MHWELHAPFALRDICTFLYRKGGVCYEATGKV